MPSITRKRTYRELRAVLARLSMTQHDLAQGIGLSRSAVAARMAGHISWSVAEAYAVLDYLNLPSCELPRFFPEDPCEEIRRSA